MPSPDLRGTCGIGVMAKAPQAGRSKTRLCPPLQPDQAASLSAAFLRDVTENVAAAGCLAPARGYIAYAPAGTEALFDGHLAAGTDLMLADGTPSTPRGVDGFGRCLVHAIRQLLARGHVAAIVLNSDSPTLPTEFLVRAIRTLLLPGDPVVLGPADDGGYYLLGMKSMHTALFTDIPWSTDTVAAATRLRASAHGLELVELPAWYDVDDSEGLARLCVELNVTSCPRGDVEQAKPYAASATAAALASIGLLDPSARAAE